MTEEYKEVIDYQKILIVVAIPVIGIGIYFSGILPTDLPKHTIEIPEIFQTQPELIKESKIKQEYKRFLEQGISEDDIYDFQEMDCLIFKRDNYTTLVSDKKEYQEILEQRRLECQN